MQGIGHKHGVPGILEANDYHNMDTTNLFSALYIIRATNLTKERQMTKNAKIVLRFDM